MATKTAVLSSACLGVALDEIKARNGPPPWTEKIVISNEVTVTAICQPSGHAGDRHYHYKDECWYVAEGEITWNFSTGERVQAKAGDFVFAPQRTWHLIEPTGNGPSIRIAISVTGEPHRYDPDKI